MTKRTYTHNGNTFPIGMPQLSDVEMAGTVRMLMRDQLNHEPVCTAARDRILCLRAERDHLAYHIEEIFGCLDEYAAMPCDSLERRLISAIERAKLAKESMYAENA